MKKDKALHLVAGFVIALIAGIFSTWFLRDVPDVILGTFLGYGVSMVVTISKEIIWDDLLGKGVFSWKDINYGLYGAVAGVLVNLLVYLILK